MQETAIGYVKTMYGLDWVMLMIVAVMAATTIGTGLMFYLAKKHHLPI